MKGRTRSLYRGWEIGAVTWIVSIAVLFTFACTGQETPPYKNPDVPLEERISDLISRMTLGEKTAQLKASMPMMMPGSDPGSSFVDQEGDFSPENAAAILKNGLGEIAHASGMGRRGPEEMAEFTNTIQEWVRDNTRLGIPILFHEECLHGHMASKGTSFPQALALASTWDPELVEKIFTAVALEVRSRGAQQCLTPVLDLSRDPRWGRTEETYGEDPFLVSRIGVAAVRGFQGSGPNIDASHVIATAKHYAVHGQPEGGTNVAPGNYSERIIREQFLKPFEAIVKEADIQSVMASYNEVDGIPLHANSYYLDDILRQEWGFEGLVVSDYNGIRRLRTQHHIAGSSEESAKMALEAGVDIELPDGEEFATLDALVLEGKVSEKYVDRAVSRVLRLKFLTGLFDDPFVEPRKAEEVTNSLDHRRLALSAAQKAITLLKNEGNLLPLDGNRYKKIAVIGPNADVVRLGGYSGRPERGISILEGIREKVGSSVEIIYSEGCKITESAPGMFAAETRIGDAELNAQRIGQAVQAAKSADLIILALGGNELTAREAWGPDHLGDRSSLDLLGNQNQLVEKMLALKKPVVVFLLHGRPNTIQYIADNVPAILEGWYLGQEGGQAVADVLFGDINPGGKLPITVPRSVGQLPVYYYQKPSTELQYMDASADPLYPFGWGLSYTTFEYSDLSLDPDTIPASGKTTVSVRVANTGDHRGDEVVQLYIRDEISTVTRPVKELKGFRRVSLGPGETQTVSFPLGQEALSFLNRDMRLVVEPGTFKIMVGGNSVDLIETILEVTAD
ncbi:MAG: glycoside hydrolase family 3 N-terminal domain-containing protein [Acidobacteriota bacterium]